MSVAITVQSVPITVTVQDQNPITVSISAVGTPGPGVPVGGTAGQVLTKIDATDFNTQWANASNASKGSSLLDFRSFPGSYSASIFIMTSAITANSFPEVNWVYSAQGNYSADEIALIASLTTLIVSDVTPGSGFTIYARSNELIQDQIPIRWQWD